MTQDEGGRPDAIPVAVLAAMKDRMHARRLSTADDLGHVRETRGGGDAALHVVDDGPETRMIGRSVVRTPDGCVFVLVARISIFAYEQLRDAVIDPADIYGGARDISLCAVYENDDTVGNIALVRRYPRADDIPVAYRPPHPFLEFSDDDYPDDEPTRPRFFYGVFLKAADVARRFMGRRRRMP